MFLVIADSGTGRMESPTHEGNPSPPFAYQRTVWLGTINEAVSVRGT